MADVAHVAERGGWRLNTVILPAARSPRTSEALRFLTALVVALAGFGVVLLLQGRNPLTTYADMFGTTLGGAYGRSEVLVVTIPVLLCALAVAVPARVGLVNVGGEGQLYLGAWFASWAALSFTDLPAAVLLPLMFLLSLVGGGLWALIPAVLRARGWLNETISTLLLNYVAVLIVQFSVFGPWKDPRAANFPQSREFVAAAHLPAFGDTRLHTGLIFALVAVTILYFVLRYTRWGYEMKAIGGNQEASRRAGIPIAVYIIAALTIGGALAGLAGFGEVSAIQGRLRPTLSPGYGFIGFLVSWLAGHNPLAIVLMSLLLAVLTTGGDALQLNQHLPFASVNLLMALTLFVVLAQRGQGRREVER
jgi:general nucleoside transport system permease protein